MDNFLFDRPELQLLHTLRTLDPDIYFQLLKTHLSYFVDDIPADTLTVNNVLSVATPHKIKRVRLGSSSKASTSGVIGAPLTQEGICRVHQLIEFIGRDENICQRNLFRRPGNIGRQENLQFKLNSGVPLDIDAEKISVYDCCEVLKRFLAELREPLLPKDIYRIFHVITDMPNVGSTRSQMLRIQSRQMSAARVLLLFLPTESFLLLYNVLNLVRNIIEHKEDNMASAEGLSVLFTPSVLLPRKLNGSEMTRELPVAIRIMTFLIECMPTLFELPVALIQDVRIQLRNKDEGISETNFSVPMRIAYCHPVRDQNAGAYTEMQLKQLQSDVDAMPKCSQKKLFYKKLKEQKNELTPNRKESTSSPDLSQHGNVFTGPFRKYFARSFKRKNMFPNNTHSDRLSHSMAEGNTSSPVLTNNNNFISPEVTRKKSSRY